jgi:hypothetical protein
VTLPNGARIETTCYLAGEYDILAVSLQPFSGVWDFAFKKNKDLSRSRSRRYTPEVQQYLLSTLERLSWPLTPDWSRDLPPLLSDPELGIPLPEIVPSVVPLSAHVTAEIVELPETHERAVVVQETPKEESGPA